jgi:uncharacterized protein
MPEFMTKRDASSNSPAPHFMTTRVLQVKVKPNARASSLTELPEGLWMAQLKSPPVDGKANQELIALVAKRFGCSKGAVSIRSGASGRMKLVCLEV